MQGKGSRIVTSLEAINRQLSTFQAAIIAAETACSQNRALFVAKPQERQELAVVFAEVRLCLDDHSSLLLSSHEMTFYDVNRALQ